MDFDEDDDYLEEGLFSKKEGCDVEIIYDDTELYVTAYPAGDMTDNNIILHTVIPSPKEVRVNHDDDEKAERKKDKKIDSKGGFDEFLCKHVTKKVKHQLAKKGYKIVKIWVH